MCSRRVALSLFGILKKHFFLPQNLIFFWGPLDFTSLHGLSPSCIYKYFTLTPSPNVNRGPFMRRNGYTQASCVWTLSLLGQANKTTATNWSLLSGLNEKPQFETQTSFLLCKLQSFFVPEQFGQDHFCIPPPKKWRCILFFWIFFSLSELN